MLQSSPMLAVAKSRNRYALAVMNVSSAHPAICAGIRVPSITRSCGLAKKHHLNGTASSELCATKLSTHSPRAVSCMSAIALRQKDSAAACEWASSATLLCHGRP